ncbi:hypothetical protein CENSYa_1149 [Cenarchaeum symbiosum A]|uniref:PRC-barrel domain-containing protein n=1 Tax=Cenarchaeum symbiosum (strain A) TaxID=414004 RepID=A0RWQ9_CENSY|nr:hypothetical protein CENSYa_1149 [Cenarchaeum symbiosum A]
MASTPECSPTKFVAADTFPGKRVVDRDGTRFGKVKHIHINKDTLAVSGVTVHQGFFKDYFLPETFIDRFTEETLLLSTPPVRRSVPVVDIDGHKIGSVKRLHKNPDTDELESITVSRGIRGPRIVSRSDIWGVGEKIILRMTRSEFSRAET